jgi:hypothetical protein
VWRRLLTAAWCTCADGFWHPHDATDVPAIHQHVVTEWNVPEAEDTGRRVPKVGFPYVRQCRKDEVWVRTPATVMLMHVDRDHRLAFSRPIAT